MENASTTLDLTDEFKARNAPAAAAKLANLPAPRIWCASSCTSARRSRRT